jgi:hypothetical protein
MWNPLHTDFAVRQVFCHNGVYGTVTYSHQKANFFQSDLAVCPDMTIQRSNKTRSDDTMSLSWTRVKSACSMALLNNKLIIAIRRAASPDSVRDLQDCPLEN